MISICMYGGYGVDRDFNKCPYWTNQAIERGERTADLYTIMGSFYFMDGYNGPKDYNTALTWLMQAVEMGSVEAIEYVARVWYERDDGYQDYQKALHWLKIALKNGSGWVHQIEDMTRPAAAKVEDFQQTSTYKAPSVPPRKTVEVDNKAKESERRKLKEEEEIEERRLKRETEIEKRLQQEAEEKAARAEA